MSRLIAAINMTLDGYCDHTSVIADEELHQHYTELLRKADRILYGTVTYQLMEYWRGVVENPSGNKANDEFALVMDQIPKLVFSRTLQSVDWHSAKLASRDLEEEVKALRQQGDQNILVGSPSLIVSLMNLELVDELQLCVHPVIAGSGKPLFKDIKNRTLLVLIKTKTFASGAVTLYYTCAKS
ncbi:MAG TPA: dihydrofolate reductase family protein [Chitinophagaceae bacterium]